MSLIGYNALTKPNFFLVHYDISALAICRSQFILRSKKTPIMRLCCSVVSRTLSSKSVTGHESHKKQKTDASSLYTHPSLLQMKNERVANRALVYDFLRGVGIMTDELDGLELPPSVEVMRERLDFLHKLGLTIEDINNYPLVLGCSVKKNMIPVLDYLGKLGVRKSTLTGFLRRYPQVLHASVVVDLAPVVKHLQGLDIKPNDIPRVLEQYPEVLGFKLEGTMSTSVAYLVGIGVARREIAGVLVRYPEILGMRVGRVIKPFVEYLESVVGIQRSAVAKLVEKNPHILGFGLEERVKPNVKSLEQFMVRRTSIPSVIFQYPSILGIDLEERLRSQQIFLNSLLGLCPEDFGRVVEKMPQVVSLNNAAVIKHVDFLKACGFSLEQVRTMAVGCPQLLALNIEIMKQSFAYFIGEMGGRALDELVAFPAFFTYGLESTVKPRHRKIAEKGLRCSLAWMLNCSDEKFEDRMHYDSFGIEEMESSPTSFDMNVLMQPQSDDSVYDEDEDEDEDSDSDCSID
ncbi:unnamed protein product [Cuscuta epithymum]|uniref:Transcription termination factor MTERF4, chloroplastic n=1 Tax=Cuscuta epithymum TaxID=186058 RepID=A0AAV0EG68_9ASTE|nr:unnamed protein product [Cuscuta epithymum]